MLIPRNLTKLSNNELIELVQRLQQENERLVLSEAGSPKTLVKTKLLIGEGKDEVNFFEALLDHLGITDIQVEEYSGKRGLWNYLKDLANTRPNRQSIVSLGITRDSDEEHPHEVFDNICQMLRSLKLPVPKSPESFVIDQRKIGIFVFPHKDSKGMLEDLCLNSVKTDPEMKCIQNFFDCLKENGCAECAEKWKSKARIHAWLSSRMEPDKTLGVAAKKGYWSWNNVAFEPLKEFIQQL